MSRIYFHSQEEETEVRGRERCLFADICADLMRDALFLDQRSYGAENHFARALFPTGTYLDTLADDQWINAAATWLAVSSNNEKLNWREGIVDVWDCQLNTAFVTGSDPVKLGARLHGQCEIHAYVEDANRSWLAGIIRKGRDSGFYSPHSGWEETIAMLESGKGPVVTSYSVCEQFPNAGVAVRSGTWEKPSSDEGWDAWYELSEEKQWELCLSGLRASPLLEITPANWETYYFGAGVDAWMLREYAVEMGKVDLK